MFWTIFTISYFLLGMATAITICAYELFDQKKHRLKALFVKSKNSKEKKEENERLIGIIVLWPFFWTAGLGVGLYRSITTAIRKLSEAVYDKVITKL